MRAFVELYNLQNKIRKEIYEEFEKQILKAKKIIF